MSRLLGAALITLLCACNRPHPAIPPPAPGPLPATRPDPKTGLTLAWIPPGSFSMGCVPQDSQCNSDEKPAHHEEVAGFWLDATDVTAGAYARCVQAGSCTATAAKGEACNLGRRSDHPINCVTWSQAMAFCSWAGGRLPSATEWEYAARSGREVIFPWGDEPPDATRTKFGGTGGTDPAGAHPAGNTPWGLSDMAGNVWQWTATHYDEKSLEMRGGSWIADDAPVLRSSNRIRNGPDNALDGIGFRCAH